MNPFLDSLLTFSDGPLRAKQAPAPTEDLPAVTAAPETCVCGRVPKQGMKHCTTCIGRNRYERKRPELGDCSCGRPRPCFRRRCLVAE